MAELIWSERAIADIEEIYDYISADSPIYARFQIENITSSAERLHQFPESGRHIPEFPYLPHREVISGNYRVIYRYDAAAGEIKIVTVVHGRRLIDKASLDE